MVWKLFPFKPDSVVIAVLQCLPVCLFPMCCIVNNDNSFILWYKGSFYGVTDVDPKKTISYIEIFVRLKSFLQLEYL